MKLSDCAIGKECRIKNYCDKAHADRFYELGIIPGENIIRLNFGVIAVGNVRYVAGKSFLENLEVE